MNKILTVASIALVLLSLLAAGIGCSKSSTSAATTKPSTTTSAPLPTTTSLSPTTTSVPPTTAKTTPPTTTTSALMTTASYPSTTTTTTPVPTTSIYQVKIAGYAFTPSSITVPVGATVTWINQDQADHTVTSTNVPPTFDRPIAGGATINITFTVPGTYNYICAIHPSMTGVVIVK